MRLGVDGSIGEEEQVEIRCQSGSNKRQLSPSVEVDVRVGKSLLIGTVALGVTVGAANPVAQDPPPAAAVEDDRADPAPLVVDAGRIFHSSSGRLLPLACWRAGKGCTRAAAPRATALIYAAASWAARTCCDRSSCSVTRPASSSCRSSRADV